MRWEGVSSSAADLGEGGKEVFLKPTRSWSFFPDSVGIFVGGELGPQALAAEPPANSHTGDSNQDSHHGADF
ncbi:hypothetical protein PG996_004758 [Apiospora saccharicola]|uniref:DUF397 domain-containing protein n=1 Tax=Apiospora saccharicola TaxID=335842 RepID=A0ABR1W8U5_9PEZI